MQIHTQTSGAECVAGVLKFASSDMLEVFITSTAELPGLIVAALLVDTLGRKGRVLFLPTLHSSA